MSCIAHRHRLARILVLSGVLGLAARATPRPVAAQATPPPASGYALVDTWRDRPWSLTPGRVASPVDLTTLTDGRTVVLDYRTPAAIHVLGATGPAGATDAVTRLPNGFMGDRLDAGGDDSLALLTSRSFRDAEVVWLDAGGHVQGRIALPKTAHLSHYPDISVGRDGRLYVAANDRADIDDADAAARVFVLDHDGRIEEVIELARWFPVDHTQPGHVHPRIRAIDVGPDGRLFALLTMVPCT